MGRADTENTAKKSSENVGQWSVWWGPRSSVWEQLLEGRARTSSSGVCHTHDALCSNQPQYFGDGTRLSVLGKLQNQGGRAIDP